MFGWIASIIKLAGLWEIGHKHRRGLTLYIIGTLIWCFVAEDRLAWDLFFLEFVTLLVSVRNWYKWSNA